MDKGISNVVAALIGAAATIIVGVIGPYGLLQRENSVLQQENTSLQQENSELQEQTAEADNSNLQSQISILLSENAKLQESNSNLNAQIEILENEKKQLEEEILTLRNSSTVSAPISSEGNLLVVCPPYETNSYYKTPDTITMAGIKYLGGFTLGGCSSWSIGYAYFNLNGKCESLSFDVGHIDGADMWPGTCNIFLDGVLSSSLDLAPDMLPTNYTLLLNGTHQLKITMDCETIGNAYGFVNAHLS